MNWKNYLNEDEVLRLEEIEQTRESLTKEYRRIYDRCRKRAQADQPFVTFITGRGDTFMVSPEDADLVARHKWQSVANKVGSSFRRPYIAATIRGKRHMLHRLIMGAPPSMKVDHIDGDTTNNCRSNLRVVTHRENIQLSVESRSNGGLSATKSLPT